MNIEQYKIEIQRTWQDDMSQREQLCNATLGLVGEVGEFERDCVMTELGDVAYYTYTLARLLGHDIIEVKHSRRQMGQIAASIAEGVKKLEFHSPGPSAQIQIMMDLSDDLDDMARAIRKRAICGVAGQDFWGEVLASNIAKLRARYPDGFVPGGGVR